MIPFYFHAAPNLEEARFPYQTKRLFETVDDRPAAARAWALGKDHLFNTADDVETKRVLFLSNYPPAVRTGRKLFRR